MFLGGLLTHNPLPISLVGLYIVICNVIIFAQITYYDHVRRRPFAGFSPTKRSTVMVVALTCTGTAALLATDAMVAPGSSSGRALLSSTNPVTCDYRPPMSDSVRTLGIILAWISGVLFFVSRVPQVLQNFRDRCVRGLSLKMISLIIFGNSTLGLQLILGNKQGATEFVVKTLPFMLGSIGIVFWDVIILIQAAVYGRSMATKQRSKQQHSSAV